MTTIDIHIPLQMKDKFFLKQLLKKNSEGIGSTVFLLSKSYINKVDVRIAFQSKVKSQPVIALCLQPSDKMKNAGITLLNLAHILLGIHPSNHRDFAESVNALFDTAKRLAESDAYKSLVEASHTIKAFIEFGGSIADVSHFDLVFVLI